MKNYCPIIFPYFFEKVQRAHFKITEYFLINLFFFRFYSGLRKKKVSAERAGRDIHGKNVPEVFFSFWNIKCTRKGVWGIFWALIFFGFFPYRGGLQRGRKWLSAQSRWGAAGRGSSVRIHGAEPLMRG